jgi:hypothetical protein
VNRPALCWLWLVTGSGEWRGVTDTFGQAQQRPETCMQDGGKAAVVESARLVFNPSTNVRCSRFSGQGSNRILIGKGAGSSAGETEAIHSRV